jgi:hypothetical protein
MATPDKPGAMVDNGKEVTEPAEKILNDPVDMPVPEADEVIVILKKFAVVDS